VKVDSQKLSPFSCPCDVDFIQILVRVVWSESIETTFIIPCCTKELKKKGVLRKEVVKLQKGSINKIPYLKSFFEILIYEKFQNLMCDVSNCKSGCKVFFFLVETYVHLSPQECTKCWEFCLFLELGNWWVRVGLYVCPSSTILKNQRIWVSPLTNGSQ
jgi:hypothetical protein